MLLCMLYVHFVDLVKENESIKMQCTLLATSAPAGFHLRSLVQYKKCLNTALGLLYLRPEQNHNANGLVRRI